MIDVTAYTRICSIEQQKRVRKAQDHVTEIRTAQMRCKSRLYTARISPVAQETVKSHFTEQ
jgi:hypothetical protein